MIKLKEFHQNIILSFLIPIIILFLGLIISCTIIYALPGDPEAGLLTTLPPGEVARIANKWGFDDPWIIRLGNYMANFFNGSWEISYSVSSGNDVKFLIFKFLPRTLEIILLPLILGLIFGIILGKISRKFEENKIGKSIKIFIVIGIVIPAFVFGLIFQIAFSSVLDIVGIKSAEYAFTRENPRFPLLESLIDGDMVLAGDILLHYILPTILLTIIVTAIVARQFRSNLENNSLTRSIVSNTTTIAINFGLIFTSIILIELIFNLPGFGWYFIDSISPNDFFLAIGFINMITVIFVITIFISNIIFSIRKPKKFESFKEIEPELRWKSPFTVIGLIMIFFFIFVAVYPELISGYSLQEIIGTFAGAWEPPSSEHPLGTGIMGRDILGQIAWGTGNSFLVGCGSILIGMAGGLLFGLSAGRLNELGKNLLTGVMLIFYVIPGTILVLLFTSIFRNNIVTTGIMIGISLIPSFTRIIANAVTLEINVFKSLVKYIPLQFAIAIIIFVSVGFLGFSDDRIINLGQVVASGKGMILDAFWAALFPGLAIVLMIAGFVLVYEGL